MTSAKFFETPDGNFADLQAQRAGPEPRKSMKQEDILPHSVLALAGSVAERMEYGKVIDRQVGKATEKQASKQASKQVGGGATNFGGWWVRFWTTNR
jgi:hypothetical protein